MALIRSQQLLLGLLFFHAAPAFAADDAAAAREHYQRGSRLFDLLRYRDASKEFEAAYEAKPDPAFLYNIGQAHRLAGDAAEAIGAYNSFLRRAPKAPNRAEVEGRIQELQTILAAQQKSRESAPAGTLRPVGEHEGVAAESAPAKPATAPADVTSAAPATDSTAAAAPTPRADTDEGQLRAGRTKKIAGVVLMAVGAAAIGVGAYFGASAGSAASSLSHPTPGQVFDPALEDALKTDQTLAIAMLATGGAAAVTGAVLFALGVRDAAHRPALSFVPVVGPHHAGASFTVRF